MQKARKSSRRARVLSLVLTSLLGAAACSSNPDNTDAWNQFVTAYCQRAQACNSDADGGAGASFATTYPNGVSQCVSANPIPSQYNGTISACSQAQITACVKDTQALDCASVTPGKLTLAPSCAAC